MEIMRRKDKEITTDDAIKLLIKCEYGILSTMGKDGQPYGVPVNYVYKDNYIYFHCAMTGRKLDNIGSNSKVSFCVVGETKVMPSKFSTEYESVVVFGVASEVLGPDRYNALLWLVEKYSPEFIEEGKAYIEKYDKAAKVIKISIDQISGKKSPAKASV